MSIPFELSQQIRVILKQCDSARMYRKAGTTTEVSGEALSGTKDRRYGLATMHSVGEYELINPEILLLRRLYASSSPEARQAFATALISELNVQNAPIVAYMVHELRDLATLRYWQRIDIVAIEFWAGVIDKLSVEHALFTAEDLEEVRAGATRITSLCDSAIQHPEDMERWDLAKQMRRLLDHLWRVIDRLDFLRLEARLTSAANPTIDTDRRVLLSRLRELGFKDDLANALHEIDRRGAAAATTFDFKAAIDLLRTFFEGFVQEAAARVPIAGIAVPVPGTKGTSYFGAFKDYLVTARILGTNDARLLQELYNYLSNEGSHSLASAPEQFHVAKVTVIEWCMMIAGRVQASVSAGSSGAGGS